MISLYNKKGRKRRKAKFTRWRIAAEWIEKNIPKERWDDYFLKTTRN